MLGGRADPADPPLCAHSKRKSRDWQQDRLGTHQSSRLGATKRVLKPLNYNHSFKYFELTVFGQFIFQLNAEKRKLVFRFLGRSIIITLIFNN